MIFLCFIFQRSDCLKQSPSAAYSYTDEIISPLFYSGYRRNSLWINPSLTGEALFQQCDCFLNNH
jgi:hypothetical protein